MWILVYVLSKHTLSLRHIINKYSTNNTEHIFLEWQIVIYIDK